MMAGNTPALPRRQALAGLAASVGMVGTAAGASTAQAAPGLPAADRALVRASGRFRALEAEWCRRNDASDGDDMTGCSAIEAMQAPALERLVQLQAVGLAGHRARAAAIVAWAPDYLHAPESHPAGRMLRALLRDLLALDDAAA